jgi:hypothetical protein
VIKSVWKDGGLTWSSEKRAYFSAVNVVLNPQLLEVECGKVQDLALVNTLCSAFAWQGADAREPSWRDEQSNSQCLR